MNVYISSISSYLPGLPVKNDEIDRYLGAAERASSKIQKMVLANNDIKVRYYARDPETGASTHTNAQLAAEAVRLLEVDRNLGGDRVQSLCCGTSTPDQIIPGHASMVHGELGLDSCEVLSTAGVCLTGITAMKYGAMSVALGLSDNAVATGSELASSFLCADFLNALKTGKKPTLNEPSHPAFSFEAEFLRWMLSDGAGAVLLVKEPAADRLNLRIDWIEIMSHAQRLETCMYAGAEKKENGDLKGWRECIRQGETERHIFTIRQDARLLNREVIRTLVGESLPRLMSKYDLKPEEIDWFLPHYSSGYFKQPLFEQLGQIDFPLPFERWFTNLTTKGNTGSASFYIMLEELYGSGRLKRGQKILGMIPESGRFSVGYVLITVV